MSADLAEIDRGVDAATAQDAANRAQDPGRPQTELRTPPTQKPAPLKRAAGTQPRRSKRLLFDNPNDFTGRGINEIDAVVRMEIAKFRYGWTPARRD